MRVKKRIIVNGCEAMLYKVIKPRTGRWVDCFDFSMARNTRRIRRSLSFPPDQSRVDVWEIERKECEVNEAVFLSDVESVTNHHTMFSNSNVDKSSVLEDVNMSCSVPFFSQMSFETNLTFDSDIFSNVSVDVSSSEPATFEEALSLLEFPESGKKEASVNSFFPASEETSVSVDFCAHSVLEFPETGKTETTENSCFPVSEETSMSVDFCVNSTDDFSASFIERVFKCVSPASKDILAQAVNLCEIDVDKSGFLSIDSATGDSNVCESAQNDEPLHAFSVSDEKIDIALLLSNAQASSENQETCASSSTLKKKKKKRRVSSSIKHYAQSNDFPDMLCNPDFVITRKWIMRKRCIIVPKATVPKIASLAVAIRIGLKNKKHDRKIGKKRLLSESVNALSEYKCNFRSNIHNVTREMNSDVRIIAFDCRGKVIAKGNKGPSKTVVVVQDVDGLWYCVRNPNALYLNKTLHDM